MKSQIFKKGEIDSLINSMMIDEHNRFASEGNRL